MTGRTPFIANIIFSLVIVIGGAWLSLFTIDQIIKAKLSAKWPTVTGQIVSTHIQEVGGRWVTYSPKVEYLYVVEDAALKGDVIGFGQFGWGAYTEFREKAAAKIAKYKVGQAVTVHFDPQRPTTSCLEPAKTESSIYVYLCLGILMLISGFAIAKSSYHRFNVSYRP